MKATLRIKAQYYENYGDVEQPSFRPKGSQYFEVPVSTDLLMYVGNDDLIKSCEEILANHSNGIIKFKYISHDVLFSEPITLVEDEVKNILLKHFD